MENEKLKHAEEINMTFKEKMRLLYEQEFKGVMLEYNDNSGWVVFSFDTCDFIDANGRHVSLNTLLNGKIRRASNSNL